MAKAINNSKAKLEAFEKANEVLVPVPLSQPTPLINAIAELPTTSGPSFVPPPVNPPTTTPAVATIPYGYPIIQAQTIESGGLAVQRLETNGLFNLVSTFIKYWSQGGQTKFDSTFGIAPGQGYTTGSVLYYADPTNPNNPINGWYTKLNNNADTTFPNTNWKRITGLPVTNADSSVTVPATSLQFVGATVTAAANNAIITIPTPPSAQPLLYQQGRLTLVDSKPYDDTDSNGSSTLYFTPTEQGNLISLWNGSNWVTQTFNQLSLNLAGIDDGVDIATNNYDVYVGKNSSGVLILTYGTFNGNRTKLPGANNNGRWVNNSDSIGIPQYQGLLVGSVSINNTKSYSYSAIRGLWNLYNQVSRPLQATQGNIDIITLPLQWWLWKFNTTSTYTTGVRWRNQWYDNGNSTTDGLGRFSFILDPLYNKRLLLSYIGTGTSGINADNLLVGLIANATANAGADSITPLTFSIQNNDPAGTIPVEVSNVNILTYSYNYNSSSPGYNLNNNGYHYIQKIELTTGTGTSAGNNGNAYGSDTGGGLTAEYWG